jgi:hypothetical protein
MSHRSGGAGKEGVHTNIVTAASVVGPEASVFALHACMTPEGGSIVPVPKAARYFLVITAQSANLRRREECGSCFRILAQVKAASEFH